VNDLEWDDWDDEDPLLDPIVRLLNDESLPSPTYTLQRFPFYSKWGNPSFCSVLIYKGLTASMCFAFQSSSDLEGKTSVVQNVRTFVGGLAVALCINVFETLWFLKSGDDGPIELFVFPRDDYEPPWDPRNVPYSNLRQAASSEQELLCCISRCKDDVLVVGEVPDELYRWEKVGSEWTRMKWRETYESTFS